jgi:peptidoglycan hydrolase-like protein with peptidoglycan-binding domain/3D (Asp-Asp-Asp) domain-containing protein
MIQNKKFSSLLLMMMTMILVVTPVYGAEKPQQKIFYVSGYYSPQEGQSFYLRGNLDQEIKLNGAGVHGASGKDVYSGMLAAPKGYTFGTKIKLEGVGVGTVDDRGGAIVEAGKRGNSYDRIDIWMGYGEEGLKRALTWGLRKVIGYIYPAGTNIDNSIDVGLFPILNKQWPSNTDASLFPRNLGKGDTGADVQKLQEILVEMGYLDRDPGEFYDIKTIDAVYRFQVDEKIVAKDTEIGAGYFGSQTRKALIKRWYDVQEQQRKQQVALKTEKQNMMNDFPVNLGKNAGSKSDIQTLQKTLLQLGYTLDITGKYDTKTISAVCDYQKKKGIIDTDTDYGAGYFGSQTKLFLVEDLWQQKVKGQSPVILSVTEQNKAGTSAKVPVTVQASLDSNLDKTSKGDAVIALQQKLQELGYFDGDPTGYYGSKTEAAVFAFQQKYKLVGTLQSKGAGIFGSLTREKFKSVYGQYADLKINQELDIGNKGIEVAKLQSLLKKLGYFQEEITGVFGAKTKDALLRFQIDRAIVENATSLGAGRVGQATITNLNQYVASLL